MNETALIDGYLHNRLSPPEKLVMEAKLLLDPELKNNMEWQQRTYALIAAYGRRQLKKEIEAVHKKMFSESRFESFRKTIQNVFK